MDNQQIGLKKVFLVIFHGGMVAYLILHNIMIPIIRNYGAGAEIFKGVHYWFALHLFLLILFIRYDFHKRPRTIIPATLWVSVWATLLGTAELFYSLGVSKVNVGHFSSFISIACVGIFYIGFFRYFKQFINWETDSLAKRHILAFLLGAAHFGVQMQFEEHIGLLKKKREIVTNQQELDYDTLGCKGSQLRLKIGDQFSPMDKLIIKDCGFLENISKFNQGNISLINESGKDHLLKLERLSVDKWKFVKLIKIHAGETLSIRKDNFHLSGIYQLRSPTSKQIGIHLIINEEINRELIINSREVLPVQD